MGAPKTALQVQVTTDGRKAVGVDAPPKPETAGAKRNAAMWSALIKWGCGIPAGILTAASAWLMVDMATDLALYWSHVILLSAIAIAVALASPVLLAIAGKLEDSRPAEAARIIRAWRWSLLVGVVAVIFFAARSSPSSTPSAPPARAQELRAALATLDSPAEWDAWNATQGCSQPGRWRNACAAISARRAEQWAEVQRLETVGEYSPAALIGTGWLAGLSERLRMLLTGLFALAAYAAAGPLARIAALAYEEAQLQADGASRPAPATTTGPSGAHGGPAALASPQATADLWFAASVHEDPDGRLSPSAAYEDYCNACRENGMPPMPMQAFYNWLAAKAKASQGRVTRAKSQGSHYWAGWVMAEADMGQIMDATYEALPYHS